MIRTLTEVKVQVGETSVGRYILPGRWSQIKAIAEINLGKIPAEVHNDFKEHLTPQDIAKYFFLAMFRSSNS